VGEHEGRVELAVEIDQNWISAAFSAFAAFSASRWRSLFTLSSVMPACRHSLALSPRSPKERQTTVTATPCS
jgi:hypothetical protein